MTFQGAVQNTPSIAGAFCPGLQALRNADRRRITVNSPERLSGSINLDDHLRTVQPNAPRWDYGIGCRENGNSEEIIWIEIHPARTDAHVTEVRTKLAWLKNWLADDGVMLGAFRPQFIWVSSGETAYTQRSRQVRRLAENGLQLKGRHFSIR